MKIVIAIEKIEVELPIINQIKSQKKIKEVLEDLDLKKIMKIKIK